MSIQLHSSDQLINKLKRSDGADLWSVISETVGLSAHVCVCVLSKAPHLLVELITPDVNSDKQAAVRL